MYVKKKARKHKRIVPFFTHIYIYIYIRIGWQNDVGRKKLFSDLLSNDLSQYFLCVFYCLLSYMVFMKHANFSILAVYKNEIYNDDWKQAKMFEHIWFR